MKLDKIETVADYKHLQIREITDSGGYHRRVLTPNMTLADDEHQEIKDKANKEWTDEVKEKWNAKLAADKKNDADALKVIQDELS